MTSNFIFASGLHRIWKPRQTTTQKQSIDQDWQSHWNVLSSWLEVMLIYMLWIVSRIYQHTCDKIVRVNIEFPSDHLISHISSNTPNRSISIYQNSEMALRLVEIKQKKLIDLLFIPQPKCDLFCFIPARLRAKSEFW